MQLKLICNLLKIYLNSIETLELFFKINGGIDIGVFNVVTSIIINLFSNQLYDGKVTICERIRLRRFRKKLIKWTRQYINRHDGTVLTTGDFETFLKQYHLIENIFNYVSDTKNNISKEKFIKDQINLFHRM